MPPTFAYVIALFCYVCAAGVGLAVCAALAVVPSLRTSVRRIAGGIMGSLPGVFLFQMLSIPLLGIAWMLFWTVSKVIGPLEGTSQIIWNVVVIIAFVGGFAIASVVGFLVGWRIGARIATGISPVEAVRTSRLLGWAISAVIPRPAVR